MLGDTVIALAKIMNLLQKKKCFVPNVLKNQADKNAIYPKQMN